MLLEGVQLMIVGMAIVFSFLGLLVGAMSATRVVAEALEAAAPVPEPAPSRPVPTDDAQIAVVLAVIAARRGVR